MSLCNPPGLFSATNINYTHATLSWEVSPTANTYLLRFRPLGSTNWIEALLVANSAVVYLQPCVQYEAQVQTVCEGESSAFTPSVVFTTQGCSDPYCFSYGGNTNFEWIESVSLNQINHTSGINYGYVNLTSISTELQQGNIYPLVLQPGYYDSAYGEYWRVWIDYNKDNDFNDPNELVFDSGGVFSTAVTGSLTVPASAPLGTTRMRISMKWLNEGDSPPLSCEGFGFGETEDYLVNIVASDCSGLNVSVLNIPASCGQSNGSISITPSGGQMPYSILWNSGQTTFTYPNLTAGLYNFTVTDASGCSLSQQVTVLNAGAPSITANSVTFNSCNQNNGTISVSASGGTMPYFYTWSHNTLLTGPTATGLNGGTYFVTVTDANNCYSQISVTVGNISGPSLSVSNITAATCAQPNGFIELQVTGGTAPLTFSWSHNILMNSNLAFNLPAGSYSCTVTDTNGCSDVETVNVSSQSNITLTVQSVQPEGCGLTNGSITVAASPNAVAPLTYTWSHSPALNSATANWLASGNYWVTVTDALGCTAVATQSVGVSTATPSINIVNILPTSCGTSNGSINVISVMGAGPFTYSWSHDNLLNSPMAAGLSAGIYTVTVYGPNGCFDTHTEIIPNTNAPVIDIASITNDLCNNGFGAASVSASGSLAPYTFNWSNGQSGPTADNLTAGTYIVTATDAAGCISQLSININNVSSLSEVNISTQNATCGLNNGIATATPVGGALPLSFSWSVGFSNPNTNLPPGEYSLTVTDANGCDVVNQFTISAIPAPILTATATNTACNQNTGTAQVTVENGTSPFNYIWNNGMTSPSLTGISAGLYTVTVTDSNGCIASAQATVSLPAMPSIAIVEIVPASCGNSNGSIWVDASGGQAPYSFSSPLNGFGFANNLPSGTYTTSVTDANGCTATLELNVPQTPPLTASVSSIPSDCLGNDGIVTANVLSGTPPFTYLWIENNASFTTEETEFTYSNLASGFYDLSVTDAAGCSQLLTAEVGQNNGPQVSLPDTLFVLPGEQALIDATYPDATYLWSTGQTIPAVSVGPGSYWVAVTADGCTTTVQIEVVVFTGISPEVLSERFRIYPNPAQNTVFLQSPPHIGSNPLILQWTDVYGRICSKPVVWSGNNDIPFEFDLQNFPPGTYLLKITDYTGKQQVEKVVKW